MIKYYQTLDGGLYAYQSKSFYTIHCITLIRFHWVISTKVLNVFSKELMCWALKYQLNINARSRGSQTFLPGIFSMICSECLYEMWAHIRSWDRCNHILAWHSPRHSGNHSPGGLQQTNCWFPPNILKHLSENCCWKITVYPTFVYIFVFPISRKKEGWTDSPNPEHYYSSL